MIPDTACDLSCGGEWLRMRFMRQKVQNRMAEVGESVNMKSYLGVSFHSDNTRDCKRMGKRMYGIRSFAYRIPHPHWGRKVPSESK